jgi:hydroxymethylbilane synthase
MTGVLRIGTRPSALATAQSGLVADRLRAAGHACELVEIRTPGDLSAAPVAELGVGVFVSALREALVRGDVDVAVHSYKDLPTAPDPRLVLAAVPVREDPRDALVARDGMVLGELPAGARVGTGSPRRRAQLEALGLGLQVVPIRGNVDTRVARVAAGDLDAVVIAAAGLRRLGRIDEATELLDPLQMLPAPAQGALAIECRAPDADADRELAGVLPPCWTIRAPGPRSPRSARCWPPWRPAAALRSARWPTWCRTWMTTVTPSTGCRCARCSAPTTAACCAPPPPRTCTTPTSSVWPWPPSCSTWRTPPPMTSSFLIPRS